MYNLVNVFCDYNLEIISLIFAVILKFWVHSTYPIWSSDCNANISRFFKIAAVRHLGCVCYISVPTTMAYLVVFTGVQNLVIIHAVLLIMWNFENFAVWLENTCSRPTKIRFWGIWPSKWEVYQQNPQDTPLREKTLYDVQIDKIGPPVRRPVHVTVQWKTGSSPRPPTSCDRNTVWRRGWSSGSSYVSNFINMGWAFTELWWVEIWLILAVLVTYANGLGLYNSSRPTSCT